MWKGVLCWNSYCETGTWPSKLSLPVHTLTFITKVILTFMKWSCYARQMLLTLWMVITLITKHIVRICQRRQRWCCIGYSFHKWRWFNRHAHAHARVYTYTHAHTHIHTHTQAYILTSWTSIMNKSNFKKPSACWPGLTIIHGKCQQNLPPSIPTL